ncbi:MAG TPA: metalloregulator ArsR/SmtB family transcription factor [Vicinamibacterales bacterium]|nr:metalloregulator ArsR/SmtB family transcription factor [Vicinamibacterales bacterium]
MKKSSARFKAAIYEHIARIGKATASPGRLELLDLLSQGPRTVEALAAQIAQSVANTSHHLQVLRRARLVEAEKAGLHVTYRLADPQVAAFFLHLRTLAESRLAEIEQVSRRYLEERGALEAVDDDELLRRVRAGDVTVIDVRPREEYLAGHIPGAVSLPLGELKERLRDLPKGQDIVAYCRGPYCVMALDAVDLLRRKGFRAHRMEQGVPEWRAQGWRVEAGDEHSAGRRA